MFFCFLVNSLVSRRKFLKIKLLLIFNYFNLFESGQYCFVVKCFTHSRQFLVSSKPGATRGNWVDLELYYSNFVNSCLCFISRRKLQGKKQKKIDAVFLYSQINLLLVVDFPVLAQSSSTRYI